MKINKLIFLKSKKATLGKTLTWVSSFIMIFFVISGMVVIAIILSGSKVVSFQKNVITLDEESNLEDLQSQRNLVRVLNTPTDEGETIKDLILEWKVLDDKDAKEKIKEQVENILDKEEINSYLFTVDYDSSDLFGDYILINKDVSVYDYDNVLYNLPKTILFLDGKEVPVGLYISEEEVTEKKEEITLQGLEKDTVVIHYTAGGGSYKGVESALKGKDLSVQYILQRDGKVAECVLDAWRLEECILREDVSDVTGEWEKNSAQHAGCGVGENALPECDSECITDSGKLIQGCNKGLCCIKGFNQRGIGIEIINWGSACGAEKIKPYCPDGVGLIHPADTIVKHWQNYTKEQIDSLVKLVAGIVERNNIPVDRNHIIGHDEITNNKHDPGAAFPWEEFMRRLKLRVEK